VTHKNVSPTSASSTIWQRACSTPQSRPLFLGQPQSGHFQIFRSDALKHGVVRHRDFSNGRVTTRWRTRPLS